MSYANKNATKCREHLLERCDKIPIIVRSRIHHMMTETPWKTWTQVKIPIWQHFTVDTGNGGRPFLECFVILLT